MDRIGEWWRRVWYLLNRRRVEAALFDEMTAHRSEMADPRRFGNLLRLREQAADAWGWRWLDDLGRDLRLGLRSLGRSPGFTVLASLMLIVGTGAMLAAFQLIDAELLAPLPVTDPATLVQLHFQGASFESTGAPYPLARAVGAQSTTLRAALESRGLTVAWRDLGGETLPGKAVSANWFDELGATPTLGRLLHAGSDDASAAPPVVVFSQDFWRQRFGADRSLVGRPVWLNGRPVVVAGVAAPGSWDLEADRPLFWVPIEHLGDFESGTDALTTWSHSRVTFFGRLRPGATPAAAKAEAAGILAALSREHPTEVPPKSWLEPYSGQTHFRRPEEQADDWRFASAVAGLAVVVLFVTCLNLGNLTLARAISRLRELSIRTALGAGRWRVVRHQVLESAVLATVGTAGGILGSMALRAALGDAATPAVAFSWRLALASLATVLTTTIGIGLAPAWKLGRQDLTRATRDGGSQLSESLRRTRLRQGLVIGQVAGSCALLVFALQMRHGLDRALAGRTTFSIDQLVVLEPPVSGLSGPARAAFWQAVGDRLGPLPAVAHLAFASAAPLGAVTETRSFAKAPHAQYQVFEVDPAFLPTMGIALLRGRNFTPTDEATAVILSRAGAVAMFGTDDVIGWSFPGRANAHVIGIAADATLARYQDRTLAELYEPLGSGQAAALIVRASADPASLVPLLRVAAEQARPTLAADVHLLSRDYDEAVRSERTAADGAGLGALLALLLSAAGIFGVVASSVGARARELGIRQALGATAAGLRWTLLMPTWVSLTVGSAAGLYVGWAIVGVFTQAPYFLSRPAPTDGVLVVGLLAGVGTLAAVVPVSRLLGRDVLEALRHE